MRSTDVHSSPFHLTGPVGGRGCSGQYRSSLSQQSTSYSRAIESLSGPLYSVLCPRNSNCPIFFMRNPTSSALSQLIQSPELATTPDDKLTSRSVLSNRKGL